MFSACEIELKNPLSKILLPESEEELLKKSDSQSKDGYDEGETLELPHDALLEGNNGNIQEGREEKAGLEKTQPTEVEGTGELSGSFDFSWLSFFQTCFFLPALLNISVIPF